MRWLAAGQQPNFLEPQVLEDLQGRPQMTKVHRVEGATENTNHDEQVLGTRNEARGTALYEETAMRFSKYNFIAITVYPYVNLA